MCEQTSASCKGPASRNNVVNLLTTKGVTGDGGTGYQNSGDRTGIMCRSVGDAALVLDAMKGFDSRDMFTALPKGIIPKEPYASFVVRDADVKKQAAEGDARGDRPRVHGEAHEERRRHQRSDRQGDQDRCCATSWAPSWWNRRTRCIRTIPSVPNMKYTFQDAFAEILPHNVPEYFFQTTSNRRARVRGAGP